MRNLTRMNLLKWWHLSRRTFINLLLIYRPDVKLIANRKICYPDFLSSRSYFWPKNKDPRTACPLWTIKFTLSLDRTGLISINFVQNDVFQSQIIHFSQLMSIYKLFMEKSKHQLLVPYILIRTLLISFRLFETETVLHWLMS